MVLQLTRKRFIHAMTIAATLSVFACGGGGSDGGDNNTGSNGAAVATAPSNPIMINTANSLEIAGLAMGSGFFIGSGSGILGVEVTAEQSQQSILDVTHSVIGVLQRTQSTGAIVIAATQACAVSGTVTAPDQIPVPDPVLGTNSIDITISFSNCNDGINTINGSLTVRGNSGDLVNSFTGSFDFNNLSILENANPTMVFSINGGFVIAWNTDAGVETGSFGGMLLVLSDGTNIVDITDFDFSYVDDALTETDKIKYTVNSTLLNGSVSLMSTQDIQTTNGLEFPFAGQIVISGAGGSMVRITVLAGGIGLATDMFSLEVDPDGSGYGPAVNYMWSQI